PVGQELAERLDAGLDALRVVEPVDAENDRLRLAELDPDALGALAYQWTQREALDLADVDGDRERVGADLATIDLDGVATRPKPEQVTGEAEEVLRAERALEPDQVRAEQAPHDLHASRQLHEQLDRWERDVQGEADPQVGTRAAEDRRHELKLVILDPHGGARVGDPGGLGGEALVDSKVRIPPLALEHRRLDRVVIQRPQARVREALVVALDVVRGQWHRVQFDAVH